MNEERTHRRVVTSPRNRQVAAVARLHDPRHRRGTGLTVVEGPHQVADAVAAGAEIRHLYVGVGDPWALPPDMAAPVTEVAPEVLRRLAGTEHPRGPVAVVAEPAPAALGADDTVVLWDVADPGNVGAICRSAAGFGFSVAVTSGSADPWAPKAVRAAAAAQFRTSIAVLGADAMATLTGTAMTVVATVASGGMAPEELEVDGPVALLVGNEAHGLPGDVVAAATGLTVPLRAGVESLNVAVAAAVVMYALSRRRGVRTRRYNPGDETAT